MPHQDVSIARHFADLPDPRIDRTKKHRLDDILVIALCAVICGADSFEEIERFGEAREGWLRRFLALPHGIPSHDTFNRVLAALDRGKFAACFGGWMADLCAATGLRPIAVDGKAVRAAPADTFSGCLHLVSAWATENGVALGQVAVADGSHEIGAVCQPLRVLDLEGALVTLDAAGCQKETLAQVRDQGGDYLAAVKGNQPALQRAVHAAFDRACDAELAGCDMSASVEDGHGRHEERYVTVIRDPEGLPAGWCWSGGSARRRGAGTRAVPTTTSPACGAGPRSWPATSGVTGASRTACTGAWTWRSARTRTGRATGTPGPTSA